ncbi:hypothetical protein DL765_011364 [Monosporascus sp. GIB2]|nr:hypothetical protein DL765_011364 [Monosporascus sp. GIB2]
MKNLEDTEVQVPFEFRKDNSCMWIRDLDYLDDSHSFNDVYDGYSERYGPHNYSWVLVHKLKPPEGNGTSSSGRSTKDKVPGQEIASPALDEAEPVDSIAVVASVFLDDSIKKVCESWVNTLEKLDRRACSAWPHSQRVDTNVFRLDDHVWIWKALSTIEDLKLWPKRNGNEVMRSSRQVQQEILRRFTTENETLKRRILAVTRSSRETRFLFHARDTALFYGYDWNFHLEETSFREVWDDTVEAQALHGDNQDTLWDNALRYALAIMIGTRDYRINKQPPADLVKWSLRSLFKAVSLNGFCPGQVNELTQEPVLFDREEDRDYYFHASFEIPFVLLTNAVRINDKYRERTNPPEDKEPHSPKRQSAAPQSDVRDYPQGQKVPPKRQQVSGEEQVRQTESMKKTVPFSRLFDSTAIVEIDEEWLYNYPLFLSNESRMADNEISKMLEDLIQQEGGSDASGHAIMTGAKLRREKGDLGPDNHEWRSWVADIPKTRRSRKRGRGDGINSTYYTNAELQKELMKPRTAEKAKKRLIWLPKANAETALLCYLASIEAEKPAISLFMDRHWNQENYFFDDTTMVTNTWETELHLSFYHLTEHLGAGDIRPLSEDNFPHKEIQIAKASMGFRFLGDFFDRYWTCHFIENGVALRPHEPWRSWSDVARPFQYLDKEKGWRQRKLLELYLFEHILATVVRCSREILDEIKTELGVRQGAFSSAILTSEDYFFSSRQWQKSQNDLAVIEEKIEGVRMEVSKWVTREKDRGKERPRWTRNDERKYGGIIKKQVRLTNEHITNLHGVHAGIKSLKETLMRSQEQIRADLSLRGSEDIRFFTYVTVVFLPLGFAASIFSMSGNPGPDLVVSLVICAIIALVITVFALVNAKTLGHIISRGFHLIDRYSRAKMKHSVLMQKREDRNKETHDEEAKGSQISRPAGKDGFGNDHGQRLHGRYRPTTPRTESTWRFGFLVAYILLEFPAGRVAAAYDVLKSPSLTWMGFVNVALGVLFIPFFVASGLIQIGVFNAIDLLRLLFDKKRADWRRAQQEKDEEKMSKSSTGKRKDEDA